MPFNTLANAYHALRGQGSRSGPSLIPRSLSTTPCRCASYVSLENLKPAAGSHRPKTRIGRGIGSTKGGHTTGRGHKGAKARGTGIPYVGFEGGATPLVRRVPKHGFLNFTAKTYAPLPISRVQSWLAQSRLDPSEPITIRSVVHSNLVHGISHLSGIKLLGDVDPSLPLPPLVVHLSRFSKSAAKAILDAGGEVKAVYHNNLGLWQEVHPDKFVGREIKMAKPTRRADIEYYTNPKNFGYLADEKEAFFKERGFNPKSAEKRPTGQFRRSLHTYSPKRLVPESEQGAATSHTVLSQTTRFSSNASPAVRPFRRSHHQSPHSFIQYLPRRSTHQLRDLPTPSLEQLRKKPTLRPCDTLETESSPMATKQFSPSHQLSQWTRPPKTLLLIQKPHDPRTTSAMGTLLSFLATSYPNLRLIVEPHTAQDHPSLPNLFVASPEDFPLLPLHTDMVITIGGDGTVLHTSNLFGEGECPPVLSFSMGSLGFLLPFRKRFRLPMNHPDESIGTDIDDLASTLDMTLKGPVSVLNRMRLACTPVSANGGVLKCAKTVGDAGWQVMNEVALHRGRHPHLTVVDAFFNGQHLTEAVADGLLLSTPTGSTAYSLSAGGPVSHPETDAFLLTPIAPRSLSFRTVILPGSGVVKLEISPLARSPAELSIDGREVCLLSPHEAVLIAKSPYPIPCIERAEGGSGWVRDLNSLLQFNVGFRNKSLIGHSMA